MESNLVTLYKAQVPLATILTGGIFSSKALGAKGLVPGNPLCATAFETVNGFVTIKPCLVVREVTGTPTAARFDKPTGAHSENVIYSHWFYQYDFYDLIDVAAELVEALVKHSAFPNIGYLMPVLRRSGLIAPEFQDVALRIDDYRVKRVKRTNP